jgi:hypothetical protein
MGGGVLLLAGSVVAFNNSFRFNVHDWNIFVLIGILLAGALGVVLLVAGAVRWIREQDSWLTRSLR